MLNVDRPLGNGLRADGVGDDAHETRFGAGASLVFTSGTTGSPKGALRTRGHRPLAERIATGLGFRTGSRYLAAGPLYHSGPWTCAFMALNREGTVIASRRLGPAQWLATARAHAVTSTFVTPTVLRRLVDEVERGAPAPTTLENVVVSGEPFPPELKRRAVSALGPCVLDCYGSTELGPVAVMPGSDLLSRPTSCGRPFAGVEIAAFDGDRRLPPGEVGLLRIRTPLAFDGYVRSAGDSGGTVPAWASVGDLGFLDGDGYLHLVDRADDMIISGGVNVFPADVEAVALEHPAIRRCVVVGLPDPQLGAGGGRGRGGRHPAGPGRTARVDARPDRRRQASAPAAAGRGSAHDRDGEGVAAAGARAPARRAASWGVNRVTRTRRPAPAGGSSRSGRAAAPPSGGRRAAP